MKEDLICRLYRTTPDQIVSMLFFDPALAYKFTLKRSLKRLQGSIMTEIRRGGLADHLFLLCF